MSRGDMVLAGVGALAVACGRPQPGADSRPTTPADSSPTDPPGDEPPGVDMEVTSAEPAVVIRAPTRISLRERESLSLEVEVEVQGSSGADDVRVFARGLPPGARWSERQRTLEFRPDFIQGGRTWRVELFADDGRHRAEHALELSVTDSIHPPWPTIEQERSFDTYTRLLLSQRTDEFLDPPSRAGRTFEAVLTRPHEVPEGERRPVLVLLHGLLVPPHRRGAADRFIVGPADPDSTYWWGHRAKNGETERVPPYTQRRVLHLLEWVLRNEPAADPERVFIAGQSMGGAGAATIGLMRARHFAGVDAWSWQAIPLNHRPLRMGQLSTLWGTPEEALGDGEVRGSSVWERMDLTRVLLEEPDARDQWLFSRHGKDDGVIHFGAAVLPSPLTHKSLYEVLQDERIGHLAVWDEGGHHGRDPALGERWWDVGWDPVVDEVSGLRRDRAFVAFSSASHDGVPGDAGNGTRPWEDDRGYAGAVASLGDTGWNGDRVGGFNRFLRWDARAMVDRIDRFEIPLRALSRHEGPWPITADVTLRRVQAFSCRAGEPVTWSFGGRQGEARADARGELTIPALPLTAQWQTLTVVRAP